MGYRSDVAYTIRFVSDDDTKNRQSFYTFLAEAKSKAATAACFTEETGQWSEFVVDEKQFRINFYAEGVKWYESYEDVKCHEALVSLAKEWADESDNPEIGYKFVRIGEDDDDIEFDDEDDDDDFWYDDDDDDFDEDWDEDWEDDEEDEEEETLV